MSIWEKFKALFEDKDLPEEKATDSMLENLNINYTKFKDQNTKELVSEVIASSDSSYLVSTASRICVGMSPIIPYESRLQHISKVIGRGHESVLEHTNIIIALHIPMFLMNDDYWDFIETLTYLRVKTRHYGHNHIMLLSGSIRGYKHILRNIRDVNHNVYAKEIIKCMYSSAEAAFFGDLIDDGIMDKNSFGYLDTIKTVPIKFITDGENESVEVGKSNHRTILRDTVSILSTEHHKFLKVYNKVKDYGFTKTDILDMVTVSVIFNNISRPISMQIIRHRNAITQESQRYVDYSNKAFIDPMAFNDSVKNRTYKLSLFGKNFELSSKELGNRLCKIYKQLIELGMRKQEARGYLPSNVVTKLMVTFTYRNLFHFFLMRDDKSAQPEIQYVAKDLKSAFEEYESDLQVPYAIADMPIYKSENIEFKILNESIDEVLEEEIIHEDRTTNNGSN